MSPGWTRRAVMLHDPCGKPAIHLSWEIALTTPRGCVIVRLGPDEPWHYFGMTAEQFLYAVLRGRLPDPKPLPNVVTIACKIHGSGRRVVREFPFAKCPKVILGKLAEAGILSYHEILDACDGKTAGTRCGSHGYSSLG